MTSRGGAGEAVGAQRMLGVAVGAWQQQGESGAGKEVAVLVPHCRRLPALPRGKQAFLREVRWVPRRGRVGCGRRRAEGAKDVRLRGTGREVGACRGQAGPEPTCCCRLPDPRGC